MDLKELKVDIEQIPVDTREAIANIDIMIRHARYLEQRKDDVLEQRAKDILETAPPYIYKQLQRLRDNLNDEADLIAWISRSMMELFFILRYMYSSSDKYDEVIKQQLNDLKEIEDIILYQGIPIRIDLEKVNVFRASMKKLWATVKRWGILRENVKRPKKARQYAKGANLMELYQRHWKIHSKYVHPTPYLIFGKPEFVYGENVNKYFLTLVQYFAALNLRDLHKMLQIFSHG